jgi:uncharacterized protein with HEPN domain
MYDKELTRDITEDILESAKKIKSRCEKFSCADDFLENEESQIVLDSICMQLIAIGTGVKEVDKITNKKLLTKYSKVEWSKVAGIRDILSHHYFDLNAETVFGVCENHIGTLIEELEKILKDI